jgi:hypothetical protein
MITVGRCEDGLRNLEALDCTAVHQSLEPVLEIPDDLRVPRAKFDWDIEIKVLRFPVPWQMVDGESGPTFEDEAERVVLPHPFN